MRVRKRVHARLHELQFASVCCNRETGQLQLLSVIRGSLQLVEPNF